MTSNSGTSEQLALARQLFSLRQSGRQVPTRELVSVPVSFEDAIDVQRQVSALEGADAMAWKVAISPDGVPVAAPLHPYVDTPSGVVMAWRKGMKIEIEIAVRLCRDLPLPTITPYERPEIEAAISHAYLGAELVWSGISEGGGISFLAYLADRIGNMGYVRGPALPLSVLKPGECFHVRLGLNGGDAFDAISEHPTKDPLTWLRDYANDRSRPAASLRTGSLITTGSLCGAIAVPDPGDVNIQIGEDAVLNFALS